jgi:hypothetical protein
MFKAAMLKGKRVGLNLCSKVEPMLKAPVLKGAIPSLKEAAVNLVSEDLIECNQGIESPHVIATQDPTWRFR